MLPCHGTPVPPLPWDARATLPWDARATLPWDARTTLASRYAKYAFTTYWRIMRCVLKKDPFRAMLLSIMFWN